ncbi:MAG: bifunctional riboflavin kinase/FAD synthetase [Clostridiales bacterium]|jgi:riboflavin kinase/FMN adenylyltransferase|nr:bifunctional riboflavin kinase/FAD synthetase [Clostridiales bacterium]
MSANTDNKTVIALGFFDGVHRGHAELIKMAKRRAEEIGAVPSVLSFDASPESVIKGYSVPLISSVNTRTDIVKRIFGVDKVIICHFDKNTMAIPWKEFINLLIERHSAAHLVIGHDFRCGYRGEGNPVLISEYCKEIGIGCDVIPKFTLDGITVSSTYIRELISKGEIERANYFLGHPYIFAGMVRDGRKVGRRLGTPTINLDADDPSLLLPARGVYATKVLLENEERPAVTNIGVRPTFGESGKVSVETYILDYDGDLYGKYVRVEFFKYLRPEMKFDSAEKLSAQIAVDTEEARRISELNYRN